MGAGDSSLVVPALTCVSQVSLMILFLLRRRRALVNDIYPVSQLLIRRTTSPNHDYGDPTTSSATMMPIRSHSSSRHSYLSKTSRMISIRENLKNSGMEVEMSPSRTRKGRETTLLKNPTRSASSTAAAAISLGPYMAPIEL